MRKQISTKLIALAIISGMFLIFSFTKAEVKEKLTTVKSQSEQTAKVSFTKAEQEYWIRWRNQFVWTLGGNGSTLLPFKPGC